MNPIVNLRNIFFKVSDLVTILVFLKRTVYPVIKILDQISEAILNVLFGKKKENEDGDLSTDELATMALTNTVVSSSFLQFRNCIMSSSDNKYLIDDFINNQKY